MIKQRINNQNPFKFKVRRLVKLTIWKDKYLWHNNNNINIKKNNNIKT